MRFRDHFAMTSKFSRLLFHRRYSNSRALASRSDSLLIGPGGELVAAYGSGTQIPAIPEVVTGRLPQYTPASETQPGETEIAAASATDVVS